MDTKAKRLVIWWLAFLIIAAVLAWFAVGDLAWAIGETDLYIQKSENPVEIVWTYFSGYPVQDPPLQCMDNTMTLVSCKSMMVFPDTTAVSDGMTMPISGTPICYDQNAIENGVIAVDTYPPGEYLGIVAIFFPYPNCVGNQWTLGEPGTIEYYHDIYFSAGWLTDNGAYLITDAEESWPYPQVPVQAGTITSNLVASIGGFIGSSFDKVLPWFLVLVAIGFGIWLFKKYIIR